MVARGERDHAALGNILGKLTHQVIRAANFERSDGLQIFGLHEHAATRDTVEFVVPYQRCAYRDLIEPRGSRLDGHNVDHSAPAARRSILAAQIKSLSDSPFMAWVV